MLSSASLCFSRSLRARANVSSPYLIRFCVCIPCATLKKPAAGMMAIRSANPAAARLYDRLSGGASRIDPCCDLQATRNAHAHPVISKTSNQTAARLAPANTKRASARRADTAAEDVNRAEVPPAGRSTKQVRHQVRRGRIPDVRSNPLGENQKMATAKAV